jgi:predicted transcriptional regulator
MFMRRLSIEVSPEEHQRLKAIAALHGQSIKEYVLKRALPDMPEMVGLSEEEALQRLEAFLQPRLAEAERGELSECSVAEIFAEVREVKP